MIGTSFFSYYPIICRRTATLSPYTLGVCRTTLRWIGTWSGMISSTPSVAWHVSSNSLRHFTNLCSSKIPQVSAARCNTFFTTRKGSLFFLYQLIKLALSKIACVLIGDSSWSHHSLAYTRTPIFNICIYVYINELVQTLMITKHFWNG